MEEETFINKRITNKEIYDTLMKQGDIQNEILDHAKFTNGKVAENLKKIAMLEKKSLGCWIARHPIRFTAYTVVVIGILVSDIRHPLFELLISIFF